MFVIFNDFIPKLNLTMSAMFEDVRFFQINFFNGQFVLLSSLLKLNVIACLNDYDANASDFLNHWAIFSSINIFCNEGLVHKH